MIGGASILAAVTPPLRHPAWAALILIPTLGCRSEVAPAVVHVQPAAEAPAPALPARSTREPSARAAPAVPVPEPLASAAAPFGLTMLSDGWSWTAIDRNKTRFDWSGRSAQGDREVLYSFWLPRLDETTVKLLPQLVDSAASNLTRGRPCPPFEQPPEIVELLGVQRVITVCFDPAPYMSEVFHRGVVHGIVNKGALTILVVLSHGRAGLIPLAAEIGAKGAP